MAELKEKIHTKAKLNNEHAQDKDVIYYNKKHADPKVQGMCELLILLHVRVCVRTYVYMCVHVSCVCVCKCVCTNEGVLFLQGER